MANAPLKNGTKIGEFTLVKRISNGGMGMVYLAKTPQGTPVVVKEYLPQSMQLRLEGSEVSVSKKEDMDGFETGMMDFYAENEMLAKIHHPSVVQVYDSFKMNGTAYSVMEYVYGQSLHQMIRETDGDGLKEDFIRKVFIDVLAGLSWLHENKILHLDIKPPNLYVTHQGKAMILDFGTVWLIEENKDTKQAPMHTPGYAPPEQHKKYFKAERIGTQTDLYALGATLYCCINGSSPPPSTDRISKGIELNAEQQFAGNYSPWLLRWIDALMSLKWDKRPASAERVKRAFESATTVNQVNPVRQYQYSLIERLRESR